MHAARIALALTLATPSILAAETVPQDTLRAAAARGLSLLVKTSPTFVQKGGCNSCHNQMLPAAAQAFARSRGVEAGAPLVQLPPEVSENTTERYVEYAVGGGGGISSLGYDFFASIMAGKPADAHMLSQIHFIKGMQASDGHWTGGAGRRPPLTFDDVTPTALMILALDRYAPRVDAADTAARIARARRWLRQAAPDRTQEYAFKVLGLVWANADPAAVRAAVKELRANQSPGGGWSQLPSLPADAYATGIALYAMSVARVPATDAGYQSGLRYLLSTQAPDGTWHVRTRALPFQPYFESGYPYGNDQWISAAGSAYATIAIAAALDAPRMASR